jgi:O-methyltransferase
VSWHKGWIPERFVDVESRRFALVHIDVDLYDPTKDSMEFVYPRVNPGGIILCDDYACTTCPGATRAVDDYLADKPGKMVLLSCGGGFLIKGILTAPPSCSLSVRPTESQ